MKSDRDNLLPEVNKDHEEQLGEGELSKGGLIGSEAEYQGFEWNSKDQYISLECMYFSNTI